MIEPTTTDMPDTGAAPRAFALRLAMANLGLFTALMTPALVTLAVRIGQLDPDGKESSLAMVTASGALVALVSNPACGRLSDRTTSRYGRRRPWLIGGVVGGTAGLAIVAFVPSIPGVLVGWCLAQVSFNATIAALVATIPDQVPRAQRGRASGAMGFSQLAAIVLGAGIATLFDRTAVQFLGPALVAVTLVGAFALTLPDRPAASEQSRFSAREFVGSFWTDPRRYPDFGWAWFTRFLIIFAAFAPVSYLAFFLSDEIGVAEDHVVATTGLLAMTTAGVAALTAALGGWISDRAGRRKPFVIAAAVIIAGSGVVLAFASTVAMVFAAHMVAGLGTGLFFAVDLALVTQVLPQATDTAKDLGVINLANMLPQSFGPSLVPVLLALGSGRNYTALYLVTAMVALTGAVLVTRIKSVD